MSYIIKRKINNTTYVYKVIGYRDESGKSRNKQEILGKLDADGNVIPSKKSASAEVVSLESLKASLNSPDSLDSSLDSLNSQHPQNINVNNTVNDADHVDVPESSNTIITASTNATATPTTVTTTTNKHIAVAATTAVTTVADNSSDTTHNKTHNNTSAMSDTQTAAKTTKTTPVATDNSSVYGVLAETPVATHAETSAEASIDVVHGGAIDAPVSERTVPVTPEIVYDLDYVDYAEEAIELVHEQEAEEVGESEEASQRNLPQIPGVTAKKVENFKFSISKPDHIIFDTDKNPQIYEASDIKDVKFTVSGSSSKKKIETLFYIDFNDAKENGITISNEDRINSYDREIYNAVATLAAAGNNEFSPSMIFQLLSGNISDERNKMSPETRRKILKSVEKMSVTRVTIDASAEVRTGMIAQATFKNYLIPAEMTELRINGQLVTDGIRLLSRLPLFDYASRKRQVVSIDIKMLDTPLPNTPENIVLKGYLLMRIASIMNSKIK